MLLEEENEEVSVLVGWVAEVRSEVGLIRVTSHESWGKRVHEDLGKLSILLLHNLTEDVEVLLKVWRDKIQLLVSSEEALHLDLG